MKTIISFISTNFDICKKRKDTKLRKTNLSISFKRKDKETRLDMCLVLVQKKICVWFQGEDYLNHSFKFRLQYKSLA